MIKVKDLLKLVKNDNVIIFTKEGCYCGEYVHQDCHTCYFNEWYVNNIESNTCYSEPTIEIEIQEGELDNED